MSDRNQQNNLNALKDLFKNGKTAQQSDFGSLIDYLGNTTVTDNSDGTISINGVKRSVYGMLNNGTDLFSISTAGVWTYDSSVTNGINNFPSSAPKAVIVATGSNVLNDGMQLNVFDSQGNTYVTTFNGSGYNAWQQPATKADIQNAVGDLNGVDPSVKEVSQHITSSDDLNNIHTSGTYWLNYTVPQNAPSDLNGTFPHGKLVVSNDAVYTSTTTIQVLYLADGAGTDSIPSIYIRHDNNSHTSWADWKALVNENQVVKSNPDGTVVFNGQSVSAFKNIDSNADLFAIREPGIWKSQWGFQNTLKNYPSGDGSATIIAETSGGVNNGLKLRVIDSWGGEYYAYWNNDHYMDWQQVPNGANTVSNSNSIPHIPSSTFDLFSVTTPGEWYSNYNDGSMKNFPSVNTAAYIKCSGYDKYHGLKLEVLDSWGNEFVAYWDNDHYSSWVQFATVNELSSAIKNAVQDNQDGTINFNVNNHYSLFQNITTVTDYNNITTSGLYSVAVGVNNQCPHNPLANTGVNATTILQVFNDGQGDIYQTTYLPSVTFPLVRQYSFGAWTNWQNYSTIAPSTSTVSSTMMPVYTSLSGNSSDLTNILADFDFNNNVINLVGNYTKSSTDLCTDLSIKADAVYAAYPNKNLSFGFTGFIGASNISLSNHTSGGHNWIVIAGGDVTANYNGGINITAS